MPNGEREELGQSKKPILENTVIKLSGKMPITINVFVLDAYSLKKYGKEYKEESVQVKKDLNALSKKYNTHSVPELRLLLIAEVAPIMVKRSIIKKYFNTDRGMCALTDASIASSRDTKIPVPNSYKEYEEQTGDGFNGTSGEYFFFDKDNLEYARKNMPELSEWSNGQISELACDVGTYILLVSTCELAWNNEEIYDAICYMLMNDVSWEDFASSSTSSYKTYSGYYKKWLNAKKGRMMWNLLKDNFLFYVLPMSLIMLVAILLLGMDVRKDRYEAISTLIKENPTCTDGKDAVGQSIFNDGKMSNLEYILIDSKFSSCKERAVQAMAVEKLKKEL